MPRWQSNFNKNSVTAKLVSEIAVWLKLIPHAHSTIEVEKSKMPEIENSHTRL
jgi:hypothetical protein